MICKIADLIVEVPEAGRMTPRCQEYLCNQCGNVDINISAAQYCINLWDNLSENDAIYLESGIQFYRNLLQFDGMMLHASAVELDGHAYLFSGVCGAGKSTHTKLWQQTFGSAAQVFNDDKPALRRIDGIWYAYGTPWCGKDGINQNKKVPLAGICFMKQEKENAIRELPAMEAVAKIISQTAHKFYDPEMVDKMLELVEQLVREIPVFELQNRPEREAVLLSYGTMRRKAEELRL